MIQQGNFILFDNVQEYMVWLSSQTIYRTINKIQNHNTAEPSYDTFYSRGYFPLQEQMYDYHVNKRGWNDIGQQLTTFPDGKIMTGRDVNTMPAGIRGANPGAFMIEHVGNFNTDTMTTAQRNMVLELNAELCIFFNIETIDVDTMPYHHWYDRVTTERTWGHSGTIKSCPGRNWFGGNKREDAEREFYPAIRAEIQKIKNTPSITAVEPYKPSMGNSFAITFNDTKDYLWNGADFVLSSGVFWHDYGADEHSSHVKASDKAIVFSVMMLLILLIIAFYLKLKNGK